MDAVGQEILGHLVEVEAQRALRRQDAALLGAVEAVKRYQHTRFSITYRDLLDSPRYGPAARFFMADLYGPQDYSARDQEFARVVPALVRMLPKELVNTVASLARLHALSERMDTAMGQALVGQSVDDRTYGIAWRACGGRSDREQQIALTVGVGTSLDYYTKKPLLRHTLRLMRRPARAAGLEHLQSFLETGFDTFREMGDASAFLETIATRERAFSEALFGPVGYAPERQVQGTAKILRASPLKGSG
jgi:hypothetical protein